jgi:hypothetical protein
MLATIHSQSNIYAAQCLEHCNHASLNLQNVAQLVVLRACRQCRSIDIIYAIRNPHPLFVVLSTHAINHLPLCGPVPVRLAEWWDTPQVSYDILRLAKVHLLQQVAHLELHVLYHLADVGDVRGVILDGHVGFHLAHHVTGEVETAERFAVGAERENDGRSELVVGGAGAVLGVEDVDAVPAAGALGCGVDGCWC